MDAAADHVVAPAVPEDAKADGAPASKRVKVAEVPPGVGLAYWRVNTTQLVRLLRNQWLAAHVTATIDETAGRIVAALLKKSVLSPTDQVRGMPRTFTRGI